MSEPPPFVHGVIRFWAIAPLDDSRNKLFPVSRELYFAVRRMLDKCAAKLVNVRECENSFGSTQVNVEGQPITEVLSELLPRLHSIYASMNTGTDPDIWKETSR